MLLLCAFMAHAGDGNFSYLYIQGDKQTPFYVKLEEGMQPRFGKNYCIIPQLAPGPAHIEILFQQNVFPAQQFTIQIPEGGSRGFLLVKSETGFSLYDLQQGFYLQPGNKVEDDHVPVIAANPASATEPARLADTTIHSSTINEQQAQRQQVIEKPAPAPKKTVRKKPNPVVQNPEPADGKPVFIRDMELSKGNTKDAGDLSAANPDNPASALPAITNTDCPTPISSAEFGKIFTAMSGFTADEDKLEYLGGQMNLCYETWQARTLAGKLSGDVARFTLLKKIYPRITDQAAFPLLDDLLTNDTWKAEFSRLVHH